MTATRAVAVAVVVIAFAFFATDGTMRFHNVRPGKEHTAAPGADYYVRLADAFLHGHLALADTPDPRLAQVSDPYDAKVRERAGIGILWDASYYRGKYYLYFSPVPVILFYVPFRLVGGQYPADPLAAMFFCTWAFVMAARFLVRALPAPRIPLPLWLLFIAFGNVIAFSLAWVRVYEVATMASMAMSATWAVAMLRFLERRRVRDAVWVGVWLALAIATRPNTGLLLLPTAAAILLPWQRRLAAAAAIPLVVVGIAYGAYNAARFGNPFESGQQYQLSWQSSKSRALCSLCNADDAGRFVGETLHYLFWSPRMIPLFPYVEIIPAALDPTTSFPVGEEQMAGAISFAPLAGIASVFAAILALAPLPPDPHRRAALLVLGGAWLVLFGLATCRWVVARYDLDFVLLMLIGAVVAFERGLDQLAQWSVDVRPFRAAAVVLAIYSIVMGVLAGFDGPGGAFRFHNPKLWKRIGTVIDVRP